MSRVLVVDDEPNLLHTVSYALRQDGHEVVTAADGNEALAVFRATEPDVVVLDVMLPGLDGLEVCRRIRRDSDVPIVMLTARDTELDTVVGLAVGADDYLGKPFSMRELSARVRALLRRSARPAAGSGTAPALELRGLRLEPGRHRVTLDGALLLLKPREFDLLALLLAHPGQVLARERILERVWGFDYSGDGRTVDTHVKTLREKLGDDAEHPRWIETVRGVGYRLRDD